MRSGRLLAEESPRALLQMYGCASLEEVFLKLSRKQGQYVPPTELNISNNISLVRKMFLIFFFNFAFCKNFYLQLNSFVVYYSDITVIDY